MRARLSVGLVAALVFAGCSGGETDSSSLPTVTTPPQAIEWPPSLGVDVSDLDFEGFRKLVGTWELASFPRSPFSSPPLLTFGYLRTSERGTSFGMSVEGLCTWGSYVVEGNQLRVYSSGSNILLYPTPCSDTSDDEVFRAWINKAETWSVRGETLTITNLDGLAATFRRVGQWPLDPGDVDDAIETVTPRLHFVDESGFLVLIQEQEDSDGAHPAQEVNWVAWEPGAGEADVDGFEWKTEGLISPNTWNWNGRLPDSFTAVEFRDPFERSCLLADMNSLNGTNTASVRYRRTQAGAELLVDEEGSASAETGHTDEVLRALVVDCWTPSYPPGIHVGKVDGVTDEWTRVDFGQLILDPVVVAGPASLNGSDPGVVEVRNVTSLSFEIRFNEWDYLDGIHPTGETIAYFVAERGVTVLPSGAHIEAGTVSATPTMTEVLFESPFPDTPVVISTILR